MVNLWPCKSPRRDCSEEKNQEGINEEVHGFWHFRTFRLHLTIVLCLAMMANALVRNTLSMAMVCMVNTTALALQNTDQYLTLSVNNTTLVTRRRAVPEGCDAPELISGEYDGSLIWSSTEQGLLFSAIYWGGVFSGIPAGWLANRYSPKLLVMGCFVMMMTGCMLSPLAAVNSGIIPMFVIRFLMGVGGQAVINPAITVIISRWIPKEGQSTVLALYTAGNQMAMIIGMPLNAYLCQQKHFLGGWPSIFYVNGFCILLAATLWYIFVDDKPSKSRWLPAAERQFIEQSLGQDNGNYSSRKQATGNVPWKRLLTSLALWSCALGSFANSVMATTLGSYIPTYYKEALHFDLKKNGISSAVPYISQWIAKVLLAVVADYMKTHTKISHTRICQFFNCIGTFAVAAFMIAAGHTDCTQTIWAVAFLTLANGAFSAQIPGFFTSLMCIAPAYTGLVNGIARFAGQLSAVVSPYVVGLIIVHGTASEWRLVFYIIAGVLAASGVMFVFFGTVEVQEWAKRDASSSSGQADNGETALVEREMREIKKQSTTSQLPDLVRITEAGSLISEPANSEHYEEASNLENYGIPNAERSDQDRHESAHPERATAPQSSS